MKRQVIFPLAFALFLCGFPPGCSGRGTEADNKDMDKKEDSAGGQLSQWKEGYLDIHQISTGRGNCCFMILPDGTTMMIDMGDVGDTAKIPQRTAGAVPNSKRSPAYWVNRYVKRFSAPLDNDGGIGVMLVTHFHGDHVGTAGCGLPEFAKHVKIDRIVDRDFPDYDTPSRELVLEWNNTAVRPYIQMMEERKAAGFKDEAFVIGSDTQLGMLHDPSKYPAFSIRNVAANCKVWTGEGYGYDDIIKDHRDPGDPECSNLGENKFSCAIHLKYGDFDYYSGGDLEGEDYPGNMEKFPGRTWRDIEKPVADRIGPCEVVVSNHHCCSNAMFENVTSVMKAKVNIIPAWEVEHPYSKSAHNLFVAREDALVFATALSEFNKPGMGDEYGKVKPTGHIVVRVYEGGEEYQVFVLNDKSLDYEVIYKTPKFKPEK